MDSWTQMFIAIICSVLASSGLWAFMMKRLDSRDVTREMLIGLGHDRIIYLGICYIEQGWISQDEYENLADYLYRPYKKMGGNSTADRIMKEIDKLPIKKSSLIDIYKNDPDIVRKPTHPR